MKFWDSSALVPLLIEEETTPALLDLLRKETGELVAWWGAEVECTSALARLEREEMLSAQETTSALQRMDQLARGWHIVEPVESVRQHTRRLLRAHRLRAADALQLAAAFVAASGRPATLPFVCLDQHLGIAAQREGFPIVDRDSL